MDFFNATRKQEFLESEYANRNGEISKHAKSSFVCSAPFEERFNKDLAEFDDKETDIFINEYLASVSSSTANIRLGVYRKYIFWCQLHKYIDSFTAQTSHLGVACDRTTKWHGRMQVVREHGPASTNTTTFFKTEDDFFKYLDTVFNQDRFLMVQAMETLIFYGFSNSELRLLKKTDVDEKTHTIAGVPYSNPVAVKIIHKALNEQGYLKSNGIGYLYYADSPYLIRSTKKDSGETIANATPSKLDVNTACQIKQMSELAQKTLFNESPYKGILLTTKDIRKLACMLHMKDDEDSFGETIVKQRCESFYYNNPKIRLGITYDDYLLWKTATQETE